jgi:hypothetical protein
LSFFCSIFNNWKHKVSKLSTAIAAASVKCRPFTEKEFLTGLGILIGAAEFVKRGYDLFSVRDQAADDMDGEENFMSLRGDPHFERYMPFGRWNSSGDFFLRLLLMLQKKK